MAQHRKFVFVCNGSDCKKEGCKSLQKELRDFLKSGDHRGKYKLIKTKCMDFCKSAPVAIIQGEVLKKANLSSIKKVL